MLSLKNIIELKKKYSRFPYGCPMPSTKGKNTIYVEITLNDDDALGLVKLSKVSEQLWEVEESKLYDTSIKGDGKLLYYMAMSAIYPAYLTPDGSGVSSEALRIYKALDEVLYVESSDLFEWYQGKDMSKDEFTVINKMYRFKFPRK